MMDGWIHGWVKMDSGWRAGGWVDGWMDNGLMDGWMDR